MKTFQDLEKVRGNEASTKDFIVQTIKEFTDSKEYKETLEAMQYAKGKNVTISKFQKMIHKITGEEIADKYSANHKCKSGFFKLFTTQETAFLLKNGITFEKDDTSQKLGKRFANATYKAVKSAIASGVSYGFYDYDKIVYFEYPEFIPLYDEEDGSIKAGIRFWQLSETKPLRVTLYELDGFTDYLQRPGEVMEILHEKRGYIETIKSVPADEEKIYSYSNYPSFPIVPLWANTDHQSELEGHRDDIDCYDLIKSGFANDLDEASAIYWIVKNAGGMSNQDLAEFLQQLKNVKAASVDSDDEVGVEAHTVEVPYQSRATYLEIIRNDIYRDMMALDVHQIAAGNVTATQIDAAYEPLSEKAFELQNGIEEFLLSIFEIAGIDDFPTFNPATIVNRREETETILMAATYLDDETILEKLPFLSDQEVAEIMEKKLKEEKERFNGQPPTEPTEPTEPIEEGGAEE